MNSKYYYTATYYQSYQTFSDAIRQRTWETMEKQTVIFQRIFCLLIQSLSIVEALLFVINWLLSILFKTAKKIER